MPCVEHARVLVADDYEPIRRRVTALLRAEFTVVGAVTDGAQLVEAEAELRPDLVVLDLNMPGMSGLEATARIRGRGSRVPIVCLTAYGEPDIRQAALDAGVDAYVVKTSLADDLLPAVRAALAARGRTP